MPAPATDPFQSQFDEVYAEIRRLAASQLRREHEAHTISATGLVHEAYIKLARDAPQWQNRAHFFGIAANAMRQVLVNHALARKSDKRGGEWQKLTLTMSLPGVEARPEDAVDVIALNDALEALATLDPRQAEIVELRYFAGLTIEDTATAMNLSPATIKREWSVALLYLKRALAS
ncbi:MAG: ECF-type sigma factor [Pseudomonadota bacterium]